jgi:polar amino acid transport system substrate-binding protein
MLALCFLAASPARIEASGAPASSLNDRLTPIIMSSAEVWPWGFYDAGGNPSGSLVRFADRLATIANRPLLNNLRPHARVLRELTNGDVDFVTLFESPKAEAGGLAVDTVATVKILMIGRAGDTYPLTLRQLRGEMVGYIRGTYYGEAFEQDERVQKVPVADLRQAVDMLRLGRIRALVASDYAFGHTISAMGLEAGEFRQDVAIAEQKGVLYMSRQARYPELFEPVKDALQQMRETGELAEIFRPPG